jgi:hypothetical protein
MADGFGPAYVAAIVLAAAGVVRHHADADLRRSSLAALVWVVLSAVRADLPLGARAVAIVPVDAVLLLLLLGLAWRSRRGWPVIAAMVQGLGLAALLASLADGRIHEGLPGSVLNLTTHVAAAILLIGAGLHRRRSVL